MMIKNLNLYIISPSSYGNDGRLLQYYRVLMQPPTFSVLKSLALEAGKTLGITLRIYCINERLQKGEDYLSRIIATARSSADINLAFVSAKSFELPRAIDIAQTLKRGVVNIVLGGAGITLTDWKTYNYLIKEGISFNVGEGEITVSAIIKNVIEKKLKPFYWQKDYVNLRTAPLPSLPGADEKKHSMSGFASISTSEGCPFNCSFCCVTTLRGRKIARERSRDPEAVVDWIKHAYKKVTAIMLTDDNLRRSFAYPELKEKLIKLNEQEKGKLNFFVQLDAAPDIIQEARDLARIGVKHVFLGLESLDPHILSGISKEQNKPEHYRAIVNALHKHGIIVGSGLMIGFPQQTPHNILKEAENFSKLVDLVHPFCVTPFPGSQDYRRAIADGSLTTWDLNKYNTVCFVRNWFQNMSISQAQEAYNKTFFRIFSIKHIIDDYTRLRWKIFRLSAYGRILAELGKFMRGRPFHYIMDGPPRKARAWRPKNGFRGFELTTEDLNKKEAFLASLEA